MTKKIGPVFLVCSLALFLSACTAFRPPGFGLPSADEIVPGESYTIKKNDSVYTIAQKNGVKLRELIVLNKLRPPYLLKQGQTITLPAKDRYSAPPPTAAPLDYIDKGHMAPASNGQGGAAGIVAVQEEQLTPLAPATSQPATKPAELPPFKKAAPTETQSAPLQPTSETKSPVPSTPVPLETKSTEPTTAPKDETDTKTADPNYIPSFSWPVRGTVISGFGPKGQGLDNDGINISAPKGSPVKAADSGIVAYAGNEMKGFGNLVLIRHEGGWVTAYAHLERLVVAKDTVVARGDMIGTIGTTGGVSSPQLHFETRHEGKPVDPELFIK